MLLLDAKNVNLNQKTLKNNNKIIIKLLKKVF